MNASFRSTATVIALTAAALAAPSLAHAKRLGGGKPMQRSSLAKTAPAPAAPVAAAPPVGVDAGALLAIRAHVAVFRVGRIVVIPVGPLRRLGGRGRLRCGAGFAGAHGRGRAGTGAAAL